MTSFSNQQVERGLDAMLIVYSLLDNHPASTVCEQFIRTHTGWLTTTFTLFEAKAILTKVYAVDAALTSQKLTQFAAGPIVVVAVDLVMALAAMNTADRLGIDLTDAVLLQSVQMQGATWLATDDSKLAQACSQVGITPETPIDVPLRQQMATWETANLPAKGLPRVLRQIHQVLGGKVGVSEGKGDKWLSQTHPQTAQDFWSQTGGGSHLP